MSAWFIKYSRIYLYEHAIITQLYTDEILIISFGKNVLKMKTALSR